MSDNGLLQKIATYWDTHIHDLAVVTQPVGSAGFFSELDAYRFEKLDYLPRLVDFSGYENRKLLEVGCGAGIDLLRFARGGALTFGIDLSQTAIELAQCNFALNGQTAHLEVMNGEEMAFRDGSFDVVYAHGVLQYTANPQRMVAEIHRVLKPGGEAILMVYNKYSWLNTLSWLAKTPLEHEDAPVLRKFSTAEFKKLLESFQSYQIVPERFPVKSRLHGGSKGRFYNTFFVGAFNLLPRSLVRPLGWHLMAFAIR